MSSLWRCPQFKGSTVLPCVIILLCALPEFLNFQYSGRKLGGCSKRCTWSTTGEDTPRAVEL